MSNTPHYLLFAESGDSPSEGPSWRFLLQDVTTPHRLVVTDHEPATCGERLELLAVVRGLEALDGPAKVTLVTKSRYVSRGFKTGLADWRATDWHWESFGRRVPVKDHDLWQRVDRALQFHDVDCQAWQFSDSASAPACQESTSAARKRLWRRPAGSESACASHRRQSRRRNSIDRAARPSGSERPSWAKMGRKILAWVDGAEEGCGLTAGAT